MSREYDVRTRRYKIQVSENAYRVIETLAAARKASVARCTRDILEDALDPLIKKLTLEDQLIVAKRVAANLERRIQQRRQK